MKIENSFIIKQVATFDDKKNLLDFVKGVMEEYKIDKEEYKIDDDKDQMNEEATIIAKATLADKNIERYQICITAILIDVDLEEDKEIVVKSCFDNLGEMSKFIAIGGFAFLPLIREQKKGG